MSFKAYQVNWSWDRHTERWLKTMIIGRTLNFPCGMSRVGDVRADMDPKVKPDIIADVLKPFATFKRGEFDTVICDPPFELYIKRGWIPVLGDLARKRLILATPNYRILMKRAIWTKRYHITEQGSSFFLRMWQIFDRKVQQLDVVP